MVYDNEPIITRDPVEVLPLDDDPVRSLYSGDISSTILQKFASWYRDNYFSPIRSANDSYFCIRTGNSEYKFYVGDISSSGQISNAKCVTYQAINPSGYNTAWTWSVSTVTSGSIDLDGYSGYIYSSYDTYASNPYMSTYTDNAYAAFFSISVCVCLLFTILVMGIRRFFNVKGK